MPCMIWDSPLRIISSHVAGCNVIQLYEICSSAFTLDRQIPNIKWTRMTLQLDVLIIMATTGDHYTKSPEF